MDWLQTGFGLLARFVEIFDTAHDYILHIFQCYTHTHTSVHSHVFNSRCLVTVSAVDVPLPLGPELSEALATNLSQGLNRSSPLTNTLTHQTTHSLTPLSDCPVTDSSLTCPSNNIFLRNSQGTPFLCYCAIVAFVSVGVPTWWLLSRCLATAVVCRAIT
jgi:hypothetical protein